MSMPVSRKSYGTQKNILAMSQDWHAIERMLNQSSYGVVTEDGRKIIKAGTPYPSNDGSCIGLVFNDYDVTDGDVAASILIDGKVEERKLPIAIASAAKAALKAQGLILFPLGDVTIAAVLSAEKLAIAVGDAANTEYEVDVYVSGEDFREATVTTKANWTITGDSGTKVGLDRVEYVSPTHVKLHLKASATTVAGNVTAVPVAAAMSLGVAPASAITIATVA
jgi:hypothetical protein